MYKEDDIITLEELKSHNQNIVNEEKDTLPPLKSVKGRRCLTKCYPKGYMYLHPVLLTAVTGNITSTCATEPIHSKDPSFFRKYDIFIADTCQLNDNELFQLPNELDSILLSYYFNPRDFLASIYELNSFEQVIKWTYDNDYLPFNTIKRVHNCAWRVFGNKYSEMSEKVYKYYYDICVNSWLKDYVKIIQNKYSFDLILKTNNNLDNLDEIYHIIKKKYLSFDFFERTIKKYIETYNEKWEKIETHYNHIKSFVFYSLIDAIESTE